MWRILMCRCDAGTVPIIQVCVFVQVHMLLVDSAAKVYKGPLCFLPHMAQGSTAYVDEGMQGRTSGGLVQSR